MLPFSDILRTQTGFEDLKSTLCKLKPHQIGKILSGVCVFECVHVDGFDCVCVCVYVSFLQAKTTPDW